MSKKKSKEKEVSEAYKDYGHFIVLTNFSNPGEFSEQAPKNLKLVDINKRVNKIVRSEILLFHIHIEKALDLIIEQYFHGAINPKTGKRDYEYVSNKSRIMFSQILPKLSINNKIKILQMITEVDTKTIKFINTLNDLRNHVAHYDEWDKNLKSAKYKGKSVHNFTTFHQLHGDYLSSAIKLRIILENSSPYVNDLIEVIRKFDNEARERQK